MTLTILQPDAAELATFSALLYGPPKIGKSTAASSAKGPILYLNAESRSALRYARKAYGNAKFSEVAFTGEDVLWDTVAHFKSGRAKEKTMVLDPMADVYRILCEEMAGGPGKPIHLNYYADVQEKLTRFARQMNDLPVFAIFLAHEEAIEHEGEDDDGDPVTLTKFQPMTGGKKLPLKFPAIFDIIGRVSAVKARDPETKKRTGDLQYIAHLAAGSNYVAGQRFGDTFGAVEKLELSEWADRIERDYVPSEKAA